MEKDNVDSNMKPRFLADRLGIMGLVEGRERGVDYFRGLLKETDKKEFSFRGIASKIIRRYQRRDESDSGLKVVYGRRDIFRNKGYEELCVVSVMEVRDRRSTDKRAKRSGINIEKNWTNNEALGNSAGKRG